ncbi:MAG TPA: TfoX/Sxy family protein [Acidimicrobiia bacterium]
MAYSEDLVAQVRAQLAPLDDVIEKNVMSGVGFFVDDKMAVAVLEAGLCLRFDQNGTDPAMSPMVSLEFAGRQIQGWVCIPESSLDRASLSRWVSHGVAGLELPV